MVSVATTIDNNGVQSLIKGSGVLSSSVMKGLVFKRLVEG